MSTFPADIVAVAERIAGEMDGNFDAVLIARAIQADREKLATAILAKRYTEDQGIDAEMEAYNGGLEDAAKLLQAAS